MGEAVERAVARERLIGGSVTSAGGVRRPPKPERATRPRRHRLLITVGTATAGALIPIVSGAVYLLTNPMDARTVMIVGAMCGLIVGGLTVWHYKSLGFRVEKAGTGGSAVVDGAGKGPAVRTYPRREIASGDTRTGRAP